LNKLIGLKYSLFKTINYVT